jgi:hypothetical protein
VASGHAQEEIRSVVTGLRRRSECGSSGGIVKSRGEAVEVEASCRKRQPNSIWWFRLAHS